MKKVIRIAAIAVGSVAALIVVLIAVLAVAVWNDLRKSAEDQTAMVKADSELLGERFSVPREGEESIAVNLYLPNDAPGDDLPVIFNIHGGAFIAGEADALDTQSARISDEWNVAVVTINYKLAKEPYTIEYGTQEVVDTVTYFHAQAKDFEIDPDRLVIMGYSAGGYHAMAAAVSLEEQGIVVAAQVLNYAFVRDTVARFDALDKQQQSEVAPALFILADGDAISEGSLEYEGALADAGVLTKSKTFNGSIHGFIEENNPEYADLNNKKSKSPEQEVLARDAERFIAEWLMHIGALPDHGPN